MKRASAVAMCASLIPQIAALAASSRPAATTAPGAAPAGGDPAATRPAASRPASKGPIPPPRRDIPGRRVTLSLGTLYVPDYFNASPTDGVDIIVWFLGASWCAEQTFYDSHRNAILITVNAKDLAAAFRRPEALKRLLDEAGAQLKGDAAAAPPIRKLCLASFSGGYVAVREILKQPEFREMITDVVLADSLYAPRIAGKPNDLDPAAMAPFLDYARRAAAGECTLWFSHLYPPEQQYRNNTTTLAASCLIDRLGVERKPATSRNSRGAQLLYRADLKGFHVLGYAGMTTQDHFEHFYAAADLLSRTSLAPARGDTCTASP